MPSEDSSFTTGAITAPGVPLNFNSSVYSQEQSGNWHIYIGFDSPDDDGGQAIDRIRYRVTRFQHRDSLFGDAANYQIQGATLNVWYEQSIPFINANAPFAFLPSQVVGSYLLRTVAALDETPGGQSGFTPFSVDWEYTIQIQAHNDAGWGGIESIEVDYSDFDDP